MKVTLLLPTLNEIDGLRLVMPRMNSKWFHQILLVDGGSTDGTVEFAKEQGYDIHLQKRKGLRFAFIEAWPLIKGDIVITFSPDGNCLPEVIPPLIEKMKEGDYDMVVASRYFGGIKSEDDDILTGFGNWLFTTLINLIHGRNYTDAMGMFRAYRANLFYELDLDREDAYAPEKWFCTVLGCEPLLSIRAAKTKCKISEVRGPEPKRVGGTRKLQIIRWGCAYMSQVFREIYFWKKSSKEKKQ